MSSVDVAELAQRLQKRTLRISTGIVLLDHTQVGREDLTVKLQGVGAVDLWRWKIAQLDGDARFLGMSDKSLIRDLYTVAEDTSIHGNCLYVYNSDVLLSKLGSYERSSLWRFLLSYFKRDRGLLIGLPTAATNLLPIDERRIWNEEGRLALYEGAVI